MKVSRRKDCHLTPTLALTHHTDIKVSSCILRTTTASCEDSLYVSKIDSGPSPGLNTSGFDFPFAKAITLEELDCEPKSVTDSVINEPAVKDSNSIPSDWLALALKEKLGNSGP